MSLYSDIVELVEEEDCVYPLNCTKMHKEVLSEHRWYNHVFEVYQRGEELVGVRYDEPSTEMQEDQDRNYEVFLVEASTVEVTKYTEIK